MYNRRIITSLLFLVVCSLLWGQTSRKEVYSDLRSTGGVYRAYPTDIPAQSAPPAGYEAFYISHYARHGSRYLISEKDYTKTLNLLQAAHDASALTPLGEDVLSRVKLIYEDARGRGGALSSLGVKQHRGIAERMYAHYPELFAKAEGITARSTTVVRCVLSMVAFCERLKELRPELEIEKESCDRYMGYLNYHTEESNAFNSHENPWYQEYREFRKANTDPDRLIKSLFKDSSYAGKPDVTMKQLYAIASDIQDTELEGVTLYDIFTPEELFNLWQVGNYKNYVVDGPSPLSGGLKLANARTLLENVLDTADEVIASGCCSATFRFGHDGNVIPFAGLLHLDGCYGEETDPAKVYKVWSNFKVTPMAANIQIIFFRNASTGDVLVKFMLNETEKAIPLTTDLFPFYHWNDVRAYYKTLL